MVSGAVLAHTQLALKPVEVGNSIDHVLVTVQPPKMGVAHVWEIRSRVGHALTMPVMVC